MDLGRRSCNGNTHAPVPYGNQPVYGRLDIAADYRNGTGGFRIGGYFIRTLLWKETR